MEIFPVKTRVFLPPKDDIFELLGNTDLDLHEEDVVCIATKCLAIAQGRCVKIGSVDKRSLVKDEADVVIDSEKMLAAKDSIVVPFAGIDESNGNGYYILWPRDIDNFLLEISRFLEKKYHISKLGIISVDSTVQPLRKGTVGIAQGICGFNPIKNYIGKCDIFKKELKMTTVNIADSLASIACYAMGEGNECTPIVICRGIKNIKFGKNFSSKMMAIQRSDDMFECLFSR